MDNDDRNCLELQVDGSNDQGEGGHWTPQCVLPSRGAVPGKRVYLLEHTQVPKATLPSTFPFQLHAQTVLLLRWALILKIDISHPHWSTSPSQAFFPLAFYVIHNQS